MQHSSKGTLIKRKWIVGADEGPPLHLGSMPPRGRLFGLFVTKETMPGIKKSFFSTWRLLCLISPPPGA